MGFVQWQRVRQRREVREDREEILHMLNAWGCLTAVRSSVRQCFGTVGVGSCSSGVWRYKGQASRGDRRGGGRS